MGITLKQSYKNMIQILKKSKGSLFNAFILALIPVLIICCYSFFVVYGGTSLDYSVMDGFDVEGMLLGENEAITKFQEAMLKILPDVSYEMRFGDLALDIINTVIVAVFDAFVILVATVLFFDKKYTSSDALKEAFKKVPSVLFLSILVSWLVIEIQNMIYSGVFMFFASIHIKSLVMIYSAFVSALLIAGGMTFLASWLLLYVRYTAIAAVSGRCRFMIAFGYGKEVLKGNVWRGMLRIMPFIIGGLILPAFLQGVAIALGKNTVIMIVLVALSTVLELLSFWFMWIYTISEFYNLEKASGIQQKIQDAVMRAMNMRSFEENEDTNNEEDKKE